MPTCFVPRERRPGETRVAASPDTVKRFKKAGCEVRIEPGAGERAGFEDRAFEAVGATIGGSAEGADLVLKVSPPTLEEIEGYSAGQTVVSLIAPAFHRDEVRALAAKGVTALAMDLIPRISRAQSMDALSSQATIAGYKAVLLAASNSNKLCPLMMTAAGTVPPAKAVIFGAGVAGLTAIATARRLGCVVEATDVRMAVKEQVESLGASFIEVPGAEDMEDAGGYAKEQSSEFLARQREEVAKRVAEADIVITTAQIPGRTAPVLVDDAMLDSMKRGAVVVDLAVETGGNCSGSVLGEITERKGVTIIGIPNLPATVPLHASELYAKNIWNLLAPAFREGAFAIDFEDEVFRGCRLTADGEIQHAPTAALLQQES
ncbi:MAG: Re/Si-specific NAD(P)(+) transhydrogenase subunit alpha [Planctomycetota bacterium]